MRWVKEGDDNTRFFHQAIKARRFQQKVLVIQGVEGEVRDTPEGIQEAFRTYYTQLLGTCASTRDNIQQGIVDLGPMVSDQQAKSLMQEFTDEDIRKAIFSIPGTKAPGPDGFNPTFFKQAWPVVGKDVCEAVKDFFRQGQMLKEVNCTKLTLIPKVAQPANVTEFRPIACCNIVYKCITKLICSRLRKVLPHIISPNQAGFIEGRQIVHNVNIIQDLVGIYNRKATPPSCLLKIDIRKAYDSVQWDFLEEMMLALKFPRKFVEWIMACVTTTSFFVTINGNGGSLFQGKQGLRQGDPMSPMLFVICMEYLSRLLKYAGAQDNYQFHYRCKSLKLNHLVFADDLILFCRGEASSIMLNMRALATFAKVSGLVANSGKSSLYKMRSKRGCYRTLAL